MNEKSKIYIFIDDNETPITEVYAPVTFELDTHKLIDGPHQLRIVSKDPSGTEGIRIIPLKYAMGQP